MIENLIHRYYEYYSKHYFSKNIFGYYPETEFIPLYIQQHFHCAGIVLDLGFGTGLWFWASFLPNLERLDGIDLYPQAINYANQIFKKNRVPSGWRKAHQNIGENITINDIQNLKKRGGKYFFSDYRKKWPDGIRDSTYDLITEHGGGLTKVNSSDELICVIKKISKALKHGGNFFFMNLEMEPDTIEKRLAEAADVPRVKLDRDLLIYVASKSNLGLKEYQQSGNIIYGYMRRE
jgi:SAM-dependent methyltransferase